MLSALKINEVIQEIIQPANGKQDLLKRGELLKVLSEEYKNVKIAEMVNMKPQAVEQGLMLANASEQVKDLVRSGAISPTAAIGALRSERSGGPPAYDVLSAMVEEAKRIGKTHATAKHSLHPIARSPSGRMTLAAEEWRARCGIKKLAQDDTYGCGVACLAMVLGCDYSRARTQFIKLGLGVRRSSRPALSTTSREMHMAIASAGLITEARRWRGWENFQGLGILKVRDDWRGAKDDYTAYLPTPWGAAHTAFAESIAN
eukprot:gene3081-4843_t